MGDLQQICNQRKQFMLFNIPPIRYEPISPYITNPQLTQTQLNMRRKVEILKYKKNSTQGNQPTKKDRLAATLSGKYNTARNVCPDDYKIPVLTTASGVPGPPIYLVEDQNVPLYNYIKNTAAYTDQDIEDNEQWILSTYSNQICINNGEYTPIAKLIIRNPIQQPFTTFTYRTPVLVRVKGTGMPINTYGKKITVTIDNVSFRTTYNNSVILNPLSLTTQFMSNTSIIIDLSNNPILNENTFYYFCEAYIGLLQVTGIALSTDPGTVYDFHLNYIVSIVVDTTDIIVESSIQDNTTFELYTNMDNSYNVLDSINCEIQVLNNPDPLTNANIQFTGTPTIG